MKTKILISFLLIFLGMNYSNAQEIENPVILDESFTGIHTVTGTYPDWYNYHIAKTNGGSFTLTIDDANSGSFTWTPPSYTKSYSDVVITNQSGLYTCLFTRTSTGDDIYYRIDIHYKISTHSGILEKTSGTWTDTKELTLPPGVTSVDMNVISSVADNFRAFSWNIENEDLSLTELTGSVMDNTHDIVNIDMNGKSQIKIIIKANDSGSSNYNSQDYFIIKSSGPTVYDLSGSGSYCEGTSGKTISLSNSQTGTSYQLKDESDANVGSTVEGTGSALEWTNITAGTYTIVATNTGGTATMNGTVVITIDPKPGKPVITGDSFVKKGASALYTGTTSDATSWEWFLSSSELASSTPSGNQTTLNFTTTGNLVLTAKATNACGTGVVSDGLTIEIIDVSEMQTIIDNLTTKVTNLETDTLNKGIMYRGLVSTIKGERDDALAANAPLVQQVADLKADTTSKGNMYRGIINGLKADKVILQNSINTLNITITDLEGQLTTAILERDNALADVTSLTTQLATVTQERDDAMAANAPLVQQVADLTTANSDLTTQLATVTQERDDALAANAPLIQQVADLTTANADLTGQLATAISERDNAIAANAPLIQQVADLTTANATLTDQLATAISERDDALAANAPLIQQVADLTTANADLTSQLATVTQERDDALAHIGSIATLLDVNVADIEDQITLLLQGFVLGWEVSDVVNSVFETEIGNFTISLYPNPNPGEVFIECTQVMESLKVINTQGQTLLEKSINETTTSFIMSRNTFSPNSMYFAIIKMQNGGTVTKKFIFSPR